MDLDLALAATLAALRPHARADWGVPAGRLDWSCRDTAAHIAHDLLAYAAQVTARPGDGYLPMDLTVRDDASPAQILTVMEAAGTLLRRAVDAADPGERAWHWGPTDPAGFAALGVNELLVHTYDIGAGLHLGWRPPAEPAAAVLARLFPDAPAGDPADVLLWCTGRIPLGHRPRRAEWIVKAAVNQ